MANISKINFKGVEYNIKPLMDTEPTANSTNAVQSGGVKSALDGLQAEIPAVDPTPTQGSNNAVRSGGVWSALQNIDVTTDTTLSVSGKPADAKAVGDALADKVDAETGKGLSTNDYTDAEKQKVADAEGYGDAIQILNDNVLSFTELTPAQTANGLKIKDTNDGIAVGDSSYKLDKYAVTAGNTVKVIADDKFQFNRGTSVTTALPSNIVGNVYHAGTYILTVPETATYLIISTPKDNSASAVYSVSGIRETVEENTEKIADIESIVETDRPLTQARLDATTKIETIGSPQVFDKNAYPVLNYGTSYNYYTNCYIDFTQNGKYYTNPLGSARIIKAYAYDSNDVRLSINGNANNYFGWDEYHVVERVDDTHIKRYRYNSKTAFENGNWAGIDVYEIGGTVAKLKFEFFRNMHFGDSMDFGITYGKPISYYVPYGINIKYRQEMYDGVWDEFVDRNKFLNIPSKCLNPWMQRSYAFTDNLVDDRKFDWTKVTASGANTYRPMKDGETVPVVGGNTIICPKRLYNVKTYDSNGVETALSKTISENTPYTLASDVVSIRFDVGIGSNAYQIPADTYEPFYLYYADDTLYPLDDVDRNPVPMAQINGWDINKNIYDMAIPEVDSNIVRMMKTFAIRELNHQRNAFRIGTFNIYVNNTRTNRPTIKTELETYGIDICGFQEARNLTDNNERLNIGDYLKRGWQFGYCNTNQVPANSGNGRALVSAYEVISSEEIQFTGASVANNTSYLKCVIQLPQYKHYADGITTLSIYNYHGDSTSATAREEQVSQIIADIAQDTSDFIIVLGDTNDFPDNHPNWQSFADAGLTPVHNGSSTTTTDGWSIDQIFTSEHITCLYYDVIDSRDWQYKPTPTSSPIPVSDHDFLYADLQFDFEAVINARNNG